MPEQQRVAAALKQFENVRAIVRKQLAALKEGNTDALGDLINQKQEILAYIQDSLTGFAIAELAAEPAAELRKALAEIADMEEESRRLLSEHQEKIRGQLLSSQQNNMIRQAYEAPLTAGHVVNRFK